LVLSDAAHPFRTSREIGIGFARVRATRISYVGELGWELYIPVEFALHVFDRLVAVGAAHGLRHAGYHAMNSLRIEKAFCHWGHDIDSDTTPLESALGFTIAWDKPGDWLGREAMFQQRRAGVRRRLVQFRLEEPRAMLFQDEPIWRDGKPAGRITSAMFGHTVGAAVALGHVTGEGMLSSQWLRDGRYEIEFAGTRYLAAVSLSPLHDPKGTRMLG